MFTPESLIDRAIDLQHRSTLAHGGDAYLLRRGAQDAEHCAYWMAQNGVAEATMIGPFGCLDVVRQSRVKIKKGAVIHGFGSGFPKTAPRAYTVTVRSIDGGFVSDPAFTRNGDIEVRNQKVHWAGTGGYWRWTDTSNVEIVAGAAS